MSKNNQTTRRLANLIGFGVAGLFIICCSWNITWNEIGVFFTGECVEGTVERTITQREKTTIRARRRAGRTELVDYSVISYTTKVGHSLSGKHRIRFFNDEIGKKVQVYYNPKNPAYMRVLAPSSFLLLIFPLVGVGLLSFSVISLSLAIRKSTKETTIGKS